MPNPITFTEIENRNLQEILMEMYQNDQVRSLEGPLFLAIIAKLEIWPTAPTFTETENRRLQVIYEGFTEQLGTYSAIFSPLTFGQDTRQLSLTKCILKKIKAAM